MRVPRLSVVIPTHNREPVLRRTLASLAGQTLPPDQFEVVVVDDGSTDGTPSLAGPVESGDEPFSFELKYVRQAGSGATLARNAGAQASRGRVLVFLDDDISLRPDTLALLEEASAAREQTVVLGTLITPDEIKTSVFARLNADAPPASSAGQGGAEVPFSACMTGLMAVSRETFFELGMFRDPTGGWPNWDDVEFGYRAQQAGVELWKSWRAVGEHRDYSLADLAAACLRWQRASQSAVRLFQRYPAIQPHIAMFYDKAPIAWRRDPPGLVLRKMFRQLAASRPVLGLLEGLSRFLERRYPSEALLRLLYRWIIGGYIYMGFRMGLKEFGAWQPQ